MTFAQIPRGSSVFLDANTLVYYFTTDPALGPEFRRQLTLVRSGACCKCDTCGDTSGELSRSSPE
jgi:hypothetical protein